MAAVAGHVDDFIAVGDLAERVDVLEIDAVVQAIPDAGQQVRHRRDECVRIVRGDFIDAASGLEQHLAAAVAGLAIGPAPVADGLRDRLAHGARTQHFGDDGTAMREIGADARRARPRKLRAQRTRHAARDRCGIHFAAEQAAERNRLAQLHHDVAAVDQHAESAPQPAADRPALGQEQSDQRTFLLRRASPVDARRHQRDVEPGVGPQCIDQRTEFARRSSVEARAPESDRPLECERGAGADRRRRQQSPPRPRESQLRAQRAQHGQVDGAATFQHVADRRRAVAQAHADVRGLQPRARPQGHQPGEERVHAIRGCLGLAQRYP